ncbi:MAG TPA: type III-B CRISPR module-associated protein Cmr5 [Thermoanaerobaculia bacterium]|jgi:CRISPR type III-B/RAMP module-associated protein Cmr5|nr:type III-B CRISPR module-associated protein Cmr5 [Thermoanaerobaculia bacterium]
MTLEQQRAALAFQHVQEVTDKADQRVYGSMAQKLPALIRTAGLCQALHFVKSRGKDPLKTFLWHLSQQLHRVDPDIADMESLCTQARTAGLAHYVWLTRETLASVTWYARLSRSEWGILPGDEPKD